MTAGSVAFVNEVAALSPTLTALLREHVNDNFGDVLPHVFIGDVARHIVTMVRVPSSEDNPAVLCEVKRILDVMEAGYAAGMPEVQELIAASFLENLPLQEDSGSQIRRMLGPNLTNKLNKMA